VSRHHIFSLDAFNFFLTANYTAPWQSYVIQYTYLAYFHCLYSLLPAELQPWENPAKLSTYPLLPPLWNIPKALNSLPLLHLQIKDLEIELEIYLSSTLKDLWHGLWHLNRYTHGICDDTHNFHSPIVLSAIGVNLPGAMMEFSCSLLFPIFYRLMKHVGEESGYCAMSIFVCPARAQRTHPVSYFVGN
jgi:hypothetical protein